MPKKIYVGEYNLARNVKGIYIGVNNLARKVKKVYAGVNNIARLCWENDPGGIPCSIPRMTSDNTPSGTVTYSSTYSGDIRYAGWHAFRISDDEYWQPRSGMHVYHDPWLKYDFGYPVQPTNISFRVSSDKDVTWNFQGSTDDGNWTTLTSFSITKNTAFTAYSASFTTTAMYRYFRICCTYGSAYVVKFSQCYLNGLRN